MANNFPRNSTYSKENQTLGVALRQYSTINFDTIMKVIPTADITNYDITPLMTDCTINIDIRDSYKGDTVKFYVVNAGSSKTIAFNMGCDAPNQTIDKAGTVELTFNGYNYIPSMAQGSGGSGMNGTSGVDGRNGTNGSSGINGLNGTSGINGLNGTNGINGSVGATGSNGTNGSSGINGLNGTSGINGLNGTNGINGSVGTPGLNGTSGINGSTGLNGTSGINGLNGTSGINGLNGTNGSTGPTGPTGATGAAGVNGTSGVNGLNGNNGTNGLNGTNGTSGTGVSGTNGTSGLNGTNGTSGSTTGVTIDTLGAGTLNTITPGSAITYSGNNGVIQSLTLSHTTSTAITVSSLKIGIPYTLILKQDSSGGCAYTLSTTLKVAYAGSGLVPISITANAIDMWNFIYDGTNIYVYSYALNLT